MSLADTFLNQLRYVENDLNERIWIAVSMLYERWSELLLELRQLENCYKRELEANLETARDRMRRVELEWDGNLEGILSRIGAIRVSGVSDYKEKGNPGMVADNNTKTRTQAASEARPELQSTATRVYKHSSTNKDSLLSPPSRESTKDTSQITNSNLINNSRKELDSKNTHNSSASENNKNYSTEPTSSFPTSSQESNQLYPYKTKHESVSTSTTACKQTLILPTTPIAPFLSNMDTDRTTHTSYKYTERTLTNSPDINTANLGRHYSNDESRAVRHVTEYKPIRGLKNLGNSCYMNSVLQCLSHTLPLKQFYVSDKYKQYLNNRGDLSNAFKRIMVQLWGTTLGYYVTPYELRNQMGIVAPRFIGYNQQDAHEFMRFLLNELHEEINRASVEGRKSPADNETLAEACARYLTWEDSRISELFGGMLRSDVCCSVCCNQSTVYIPFMDIALPIPERKCTYPRPIHLYSIPYYTSAVHLTKCLNMLITKENLDEEERPYCNKCMKLTKSTKQLSIAKLPRFLVIQLKRFSYYPKPTKLSTPVKFDEIWRLLDIDNKIHTYSLYGIVCHSGSMSSGHYTSYCKYKDQWRCFDDEITAEVSWEQVKVQEAYILLYAEEAIF